MLVKTVDSGSLHLDTGESFIRQKSTYTLLTKDIFNSCPFKDYIFGTQDVCFIYWAGSILNNTVDELSDFDLVVVTKDPILPKKENYFLEYMGHKLHGYYQYFDSLISDILDKADFALTTGRCQLANLDFDKVLYINNKYYALFEYFFNNKDIIANIGLYMSFILSKVLISHFGEVNNSIDKPTIGLPYYLYKILLLYYQLINATPDYSFIKRVKRAMPKNIDISTEDYIKLYEILNNYMQIVSDDTIITKQLDILKSSWSCQELL